MKLKAGLVVVTLLAGAVQAATDIQPSTSSTQDAKATVDKAVSAVKTLAESGNPAVQAFAAHLGKALMKHRIQVAGLPGVVATTAPAKLSEQERAMIKRAWEKQLWPAALDVSPQLAYDLNVVAAEECPDMATRLMAVMLLLNPPDNSNALMPEPAVAVRIVEKTFAKAFEFHGDCLTDDARVVLETGAVVGGMLMGPYLQHKVMTLEPLTKESFEKAVGELLTQAEATSKTVKKEAKLLDPLMKALKEAQKESGHFVELGQALKAVTAVVGKMFDAANKRDMAAFRACFAGPAKLDEEEPKEPKPKFQFVGLRGWNFVRGEDGKVKTIRGIVQWAEIDDKGSSKFVREEMSFVNTPKGWLIRGLAATLPRPIAR